MSDPIRDNSQKIREVTSALAEGKLPTTDQIVSGIESLQKTGSFESASQGLSTDGKKVLLDAERLVEDTRKTLKQKMPNNELQNVIYYSSVAGQQAGQSGVAYDAQSAANELVQAGARAAQLARMIVTSPEFRGVLREVNGIVQEVMRSNIRDASDEVASDPNVPERVRQGAARTRDELNQNDLQGAAQNLKGSAQVKADELKGRAKAEYQGTKQEAKETAGDVQNRARDTGDATYRAAGDTVSQGGSLRDTSHAIVDAVADKAEQHLPADTVNKVSGTTRDTAARLYQGESAGDIKQNIVDSARGLAQDLTQRAKEEFNNQKQQLAPLKDTGIRVAQQLSDLPQDKRDEIVRRFKAVARTLQNKPEFRAAFDDLIGLLRDLGNKAAIATDTMVQKVAEAPTNPEEIEATREAKLAALNAKQLIENFANGKSLDNLILSIRKFADEARSDNELQAFWTDLSSYITRSFKESGFTDSPDYDKQAVAIVERGRRALSKYDYHTQKIVYESSNYADALASDRATQKLASDVNSLFADLFLDERGKPTFKPELLRDLAKAVPTIADKLAYLPIPRTEIDDGTYHLIFDNIILHSTILPKYVHLVTDTTVDATKDDPNKQLANSVLLEMSNIEASARDIAWLANKHSGFWKAGDVGLADFDIKSPGLQLKLKINPNPAVQPSPSTKGAAETGQYLQLETVSCTVAGLDLRLHDSHHDILYKVLKPVLNRTVKAQIEKAVENAIKDMFYKLDTQMARAAQAGSYEIVEGRDPAKGLPEWGSKAFDPARV